VALPQPRRSTPPPDRPQRGGARAHGSGAAGPPSLTPVSGQAPTPGTSGERLRQQRQTTSVRVPRRLKWLYPGMRVKRWLALIPVGLVLGVLGVMVLFNQQMQLVNFTTGCTTKSPPRSASRSTKPSFTCPQAAYFCCWG
jgi:hypothetical protein